MVPNVPAQLRQLTFSLGIELRSPWFTFLIHFCQASVLFFHCQFAYKSFDSFEKSSVAIYFERDVDQLGLVA